MSSESEPMVGVIATGHQNGYMNELMEKRIWTDEWESAAP
jgi:hypothetical protein